VGLMLLCVRAPHVLPARPSASVRMGAAAASQSAFERWAEDKGISAPALRLDDFDGLRGVSATKDLAPNERILAVPSRLALQVTTTQRAPQWASDELWRAAPWHHRLALTLLHEESKVDSPLRPWLEELPTSIHTPISWDAEQLLELGYAPMVDDVRTQREEWDALVQRLQRDPPEGVATDRESVYRALSIVRSRSFSGPFAGGTFKGSLVQLFLACTAAGAFAISGGNAELALDGFLGVAVYLLANDLFFSRATSFKRYVLCPFIDMMNHASSRGATDVSYEYFSDNFAVVLDDKPVKKGTQANICYGPRSNDALMQYYGFVEPGNPHDTCAVPQPAFLIDLAEVVSFEPTNLRALASLELPETLVFSRTGADAAALRIARLALYPAEATAAGQGGNPLPLACELAVMRALAAVAERASARFAPSGTGVGFGQTVAPTKSKKKAGDAADATSELIAAFRREKSGLLHAAANELLERAQACDAAGELIETEESAATTAAPPGLGLTKIA